MHLQLHFVTFRHGSAFFFRFLRFVPFIFMGKGTNQRRASGERKMERRWSPRTPLRTHTAQAHELCACSAMTKWNVEEKAKIDFPNHRAHICACIHRRTPNTIAQVARESIYYTRRALLAHTKWRSDARRRYMQRDGRRRRRRRRKRKNDIQTTDPTLSL